jgi:hypothetical protein
MAFLLPVLEGLGSGLLGNALGGALGSGTAGNAEKSAMNALNTQDETFPARNVFFRDSKPRAAADAIRSLRSDDGRAQREHA